MVYYEGLKSKRLQIIKKSFRICRIGQKKALQKVGVGFKFFHQYTLPIGEHRTISQPYIVALMTQSLGLTGKENVLEIG